MDKVIMVIGLMLIIYASMSIIGKDICRVKYNNMIFNNRIQELKDIITDKDITYQARIEELLFMKNKFF